MAEPIQLTLGDDSIIVGQTLEEAERKLAALKKKAPNLETQIIDCATEETPSVRQKREQTEMSGINYGSMDRTRKKLRQTGS